MSSDFLVAAIMNLPCVNPHPEDNCGLYSQGHRDARHAAAELVAAAEDAPAQPAQAQPVASDAQLSALIDDVVGLCQYDGEYRVDYNDLMKLLRTAAMHHTAPAQPQAVAGELPPLPAMQLLEQCQLMLADAAWRCSPPLTGLRNLQEKIAVALAAPAASAVNTDAGVDYIMAAVQSYAESREAGTLDRIRRMVSESVPAAPAVAVSAQDAARLEYIYQIAMCKPFIAPIATKEKWIASIDAAILAAKGATA